MRKPTGCGLPAQMSIKSRAPLGRLAVSAIGLEIFLGVGAIGGGAALMLAGSAIQIAGYRWMFIFIALLNIPGLWITWKNRSSLQ